MNPNKIDLERIFSIASEIEELREKLGLSPIEACIHFCEENDIEADSLGEILKTNAAMVRSIRREAESLHCLPRTAKIPLTA